MSEIKVNKISPATGTAFTLGDSGDTFTLPSGATITNSGTATGFGGGKVLQAVTATSSSELSTSSTSLQTAMTCTITPATTGSKILLILNSGSLFADGPAGVFTMMRDSTNLGDATNGMGSCNDSQIKTIHAHWLDSPSTTSAVAYTAKYRTINASYTIYFNAGTTPGRGGAKQMAPNYGSFTAIEIGA